VRSGAWKGWLHSGSSTVARPDGTAAIVGKFSQPDLVILDIAETPRLHNGAGAATKTANR